ncbi:hypothetical protein PV703_07785 [Streptomyces sp. ME01-24h]|nr:hypothetical protein [Streptomyces sp. ME19-03-3]MDX3353222.1 hypothetical protein [Streptomyces sp. ME01-24h]
MLLAWAAGTAVPVPLFAGLGAAGRFHGGVFGAVYAAFLVGVLGVLPPYGLALAWRDRDHRTPAWVVHLATALVWSALLSCLTSVLLMGLPHGWESALSVRDILLRTGWIAFLVTPSAVGAYAATVAFPAEGGPLGGGPGRRGGRHR